MSGGGIKRQEKLSQKLSKISPEKRQSHKVLIDSSEIKEEEDKNKSQSIRYDSISHQDLNAEEDSSDSQEEEVGGSDQDPNQELGRRPNKAGSRKLWSVSDEAIENLVDKFGTKRWTYIAQKLRDDFKIQGRTGKQCRERYTKIFIKLTYLLCQSTLKQPLHVYRWHNHLDPEIKKDPITPEEERVIFESHRKYGNKWADIAKLLPGRSDNSIKNYFYSTLRKHIRRINKSLRQSQIARKLGLKMKNLTSEQLYEMVRNQEITYEKLQQMDPKRFQDLEYTMKLIYNHDLPFNTTSSINQSITSQGQGTDRNVLKTTEESKQQHQIKPETQPSEQIGKRSRVGSDLQQTTPSKPIINQQFFKNKIELLQDLNKLAEIKEPTNIKKDLLVQQQIEQDKSFQNIIEEDQQLYRDSQSTPTAQSKRRSKRLTGKKRLNYEDLNDQCVDVIRHIQSDQNIPVNMDEGLSSSQKYNQRMLQKNQLRHSQNVYEDYQRFQRAPMIKRKKFLTDETVSLGQSDDERRTDIRETNKIIQQDRKEDKIQYSQTPQPIGKQVKLEQQEIKQHNELNLPTNEQLQTKQEDESMKDETTGQQVNQRIRQNKYRQDDELFLRVMSEQVNFIPSPRQKSIQLPSPHQDKDLEQTQIGDKDKIMASSQAVGGASTPHAGLDDLKKALEIQNSLAHQSLQVQGIGLKSEQIDSINNRAGTLTQSNTPAKTFLQTPTSQSLKSQNLKIESTQPSQIIFQLNNEQSIQQPLYIPLSQTNYKVFQSPRFQIQFEDGQPQIPPQNENQSNLEGVLTPGNYIQQSSRNLFQRPRLASEEIQSIPQQQKLEEVKQEEKPQQNQQQQQMQQQQTVDQTIQQSMGKQLLTAQNLNNQFNPFAIKPLRLDYRSIYGMSPLSSVQTSYTVPSPYAIPSPYTTLTSPYTLHLQSPSIQFQNELMMNQKQFQQVQPQKIVMQSPHRFMPGQQQYVLVPVMPSPSAAQFPGVLQSPLQFLQRQQRYQQNQGIINPPNPVLNANRTAQMLNQQGQLTKQSSNSSQLTNESKMQPPSTSQQKEQQQQNPNE
eukprot:403331496